MKQIQNVQLARPGADQDRVVLVGYDREGAQVLEQQISAAEFYERANPLLDECSFRKSHHVFRIRGTVLSHGGTVSGSFELCCDSEGTILVT